MHVILNKALFHKNISFHLQVRESEPVRISSLNVTYVISRLIGS